jgi:hypothetical protein
MAKYSNTVKLVQVRLDQEFLTAVEDFRRAQPDLPSRPVAVCRLAALALADLRPAEATAT